MLPDRSNWAFGNIASADTERAQRLESAGSRDQLLLALSDALALACSNGMACILREHAEDQPQDCRAVIQFPVGSRLFDWFFNSRDGYRAHFWASPELGLEFNDRAVDRLRSTLNTSLSPVCNGWDWLYGSQQAQQAAIPREILNRSLVPRLSKIWPRTQRLKHNGEFENVPLGFDGTVILVGERRWRALCPDDQHAWLELKGAFLGKDGPYQWKDPVDRAKRLQSDGEA